MLLIYIIIDSLSQVFSMLRPDFSEELYINIGYLIGPDISDRLVFPCLCDPLPVHHDNHFYQD